MPSSRPVPWAQIPVGDRTRDRGHGRKETRTIKAVTLHTPGGIAFAHARQAARIIRTRTVNGKTSRETAYLVTSLLLSDGLTSAVSDSADNPGCVGGGQGEVDACAAAGVVGGVDVSAVALDEAVADRQP
jgi:hypothetical protein